MTDTPKGESMRAAHEARDAIVSRPRASKTDAIAGALRRYLGAEAYDEHRRSAAERAEKESRKRDRG